jgi:toxin-antitoxin system PIN domain toxin
LIAIDTNVLLYAHREETEFHLQAYETLKDLAEDFNPWGIPVFCLGEFLRVSTHPRVFDPPSKPEAALAALEDLMTSPSVRILNPEERYLRLLGEVVRSADVRGNLIFDAQIVAVCLEHGVSELVTWDRDFSRFPKFRLRTPQ